MRWVFWILSLFALAVAVALALRSSPGYALLVWPPYRVELSINLLVLLLVAGFAVGDISYCALCWAPLHYRHACVLIANAAGVTMRVLV